MNDRGRDFLLCNSETSDGRPTEWFTLSIISLSEVFVGKKVCNICLLLVVKCFEESFKAYYLCISPSQSHIK